MEMTGFTQKLQKEIERKIVQIETSDHSILNKSIEASRVLGDAFKRLKEFIISYEFASEEEEILFFKEIKPRLFSRLIYYRKIYNIEMNRPVGSIESQKEYLLTEMDDLGRYTRKRVQTRVFRKVPKTVTRENRPRFFLLYTTLIISASIRDKVPYRFASL